MLKHVLLLALLALLAPLGPAQEAPAQDPASPAPAAVALLNEDLSFASLGALQRSRAAKRLALKELRAKLAETTLEDERAELQGHIATLQKELDKLNADFESIATGIDIAAFDMAAAESFDLQTEMQKLVQPLIEELKDATEAPRQIDRLRGQIEHLEGRSELATEAVESIDRLIAELPEGDPENLGPALEESRAAWQARLEDLQGQQTVTRFQLEKRLSQRKSLLGSTQSALSDFFRTRGLNLVLAIATFFLVLLLLRALYRYLSRVIPRKQRDERLFYARLIDVLYFLFVGAFALVASLLVLYATGDWVLLGLTVLFMLGAAWGFKTAVPMFLEQIRLLLNLGTVREHERLLFDGVPYRVSKLSFYTLLSNPDLAGGVRRLPIKDLAELRSRTCSKDEIWFPCRRGDWVLLSDGRRGEVVHQSPDTVQLQLLGGSRVTYLTADFLALAPENLSRGFRRQVRFGIDYEHQAICTGEVPEIFADRIKRGLEESYGDSALNAFKVEFCEAGASSLDYLVVADFDGAVAGQYDAIGRRIQRLCVDTCNEQGWGIPFTQITLHQAPAG